MIAFVYSLNIAFNYFASDSVHIKRYVRASATGEVVNQYDSAALGVIIKS